MLEASAARLSLLACFSDFYQEVAALKLAIAEGRLSVELAHADEAPIVEPRAQAARASARLSSILQRQLQTVARDGAPGEVRAFDMAAYVFAALADEIFILELDWPGREAWLDELLEYKLFKTREAGHYFYRLAEGIQEASNLGRLHAELAAVLLLALQLGFAGQYRGSHGKTYLVQLKARLSRLAQSAGVALENDQSQVFSAAYNHLLTEGETSRLAPTAPWRIGVIVMLLVYVVLSAIVWEWVIRPVAYLMGA